LFLQGFDFVLGGGIRVEFDGLLLLALTLDQVALFFRVDFRDFIALLASSEPSFLRIGVVEVGVERVSSL